MTNAAAGLPPTLERLGRVGIPVVALAVDMLLWGFDNETRFDGLMVPAWLVVVLAIPAYATLARPDRPLLGYAALWALSLIGIPLPHYDSVAGILVALFVMARRSAQVPARMALIGSLVPLGIYTLNASAFGGSFDASAAVVSGALWLLVFSAAWLAGRTLARGDDLLRRGEVESARLRAEAIQKEKLHISRELHDILGHALTAITMQAAGAASGRRAGTVDDEEIDRALADIQATGSQSMRELHRLLGLLRGASAADRAQAEASVGSWRTLAEIDGLMDTGRAAGLEVTYTRSGAEEELDPSIGHAAFRVVQEGLSNAMKYAPHGSRVDTALVWTPGKLDLTITNPVAKVRHPGTVSGGFGLAGLRERVLVVGGSLRATAEPGKFILHATLPTTGSPAD